MTPLPACHSLQGACSGANTIEPGLQYYLKLAQRDPRHLVIKDVTGRTYPFAFNHTFRCGQAYMLHRRRGQLGRAAGAQQQDLHACSAVRRTWTA